MWKNKHKNQLHLATEYATAATAAFNSKHD